MTRGRLLLAIFWAAVLCVAVQAQPVARPHVQVELVAEHTSIQPGRSLQVGLLLDIEEHWHVYWRNPGDSGIPTEIEWNLPPGFTAGPIQWPAPKRLPLAPLMNYGYEGLTLLPVTIQTPADLQPGATVKIKAHARWLICREECLPGDAELELELPVSAAEPSPDGYWSKDFKRARSAMPVTPANWTVSAETSAKGVRLVVRGSGQQAAEISDLYFFPHEAGLIEPAAPQVMQKQGDHFTLLLPPAPRTTPMPGGISGVLVADAGWDDQGHRALAVDAMFESQPTRDASLLMLTLGAFAGGMMLNLMPCVFPILSIKILGFVRQAGENPARTRRHGYMFGIGVIASFWVLAGLLLALRAGGEELGWGFQLQSPQFIIVMTFLMFAIGLSLLGVFEIGTSLIRIAGKAEAGGYTGSFLSGVLATVIATPCTAPFMGAALGVALTLSTATALLIFTALGLGMAMPYVVLSCSPRLLRYLPRPGAWMESFKQFMAFPMFATAAWLIWVLGLQAGVDAMAAMLLGLLLLAIGGWVYGRWSHPLRRPVSRWISKVVVAAALIAAFAVALNAVGKDDGPTWETFSEQRLSELRQSGRPVFINFTAAWCLTCKANELTVFRTQQVVDQFAHRNVALLKADWTLKSPEITRALERFGRSSVPLYVLYPANTTAEPRVLPTVITADMVVREIDESL